MKYLSTFEVAEKWGISPRRVGILCNNDRIPGAQRAGSRWIIPEDAEKPTDARIKSGKYEYAKLLEEKKKIYAEYRRSREEMRELLTAKANVDRLLKMDEEQKQEKEKDHDQR